MLTNDVPDACSGTVDDRAPRRRRRRTIVIGTIAAVFLAWAWGAYEVSRVFIH